MRIPKNRTAISPLHSHQIHILLEPDRRVLTVSLDGVMLWESASVPGQGAGTPQASKDGRHFAITHNLNQQGYFSVFDTTSTETEPIYQYQSDLVVFENSTPFSAVG